jgi:hypothetical protein
MFGFCVFERKMSRLIDPAHNMLGKVGLEGEKKGNVPVFIELSTSFHKEPICKNREISPFSGACYGTEPAIECVVGQVPDLPHRL